MISPLFTLLLLSLLWHPVTAVPTPLESLEERADISVLTQAQVDSYTPYSIFASIAGCSPASTLAWNCQSCSKLSDFKPIASGGNGGTVQYWFVGYSPSLSSIVVVYQGTDASKIVPLLTDLNIAQTTPDQTLFPGIPTGAKVHGGFLSAFTGSQANVLAAVQKGASTYGTKQIAVVGHSLGASIATISAASLKLRLGSGYTLKVVGYGMPRVGNQAWVTWVDNNLTDLKRINNKKDPVPILPGRFLGFVGSNGEIHINGDGSWINCPGDDNTDENCTVTYVGSILTGDASDHNGPYNGITMGGCDD